ADLPGHRSQPGPGDHRVRPRLSDALLETHCGAAGLRLAWRTVVCQTSGEMSSICQARPGSSTMGIEVAEDPEHAVESLAPHYGNGPGRCGRGVRGVEQTPEAPPLGGTRNLSPAPTLPEPLPEHRARRPLRGPLHLQGMSRREIRIVYAHGPQPG